MYQIQGNGAKFYFKFSRNTFTLNTALKKYEKTECGIYIEDLEVRNS